MNLSPRSSMEAKADAIANGGISERITIRNRYEVECFDRDGNLKWREDINNLVTNQGLNDWLDKYLKGSAYTADWYVGLIDGKNFGSIDAGDTAAGISLAEASGSGTPNANRWLELDDYSESTRQALTLGTVSGQSVDNSASKASFSISADAIIEGAFVVNDAGVGSQTGSGDTKILLGAAAFSTQRTMASGDTLNVTVTLTAASG